MGLKASLSETKHPLPHVSLRYTDLKERKIDLFMSLNASLLHQNPPYGNQPCSCLTPPSLSLLLSLSLSFSSSFHNLLLNSVCGCSDVSVFQRPPSFLFLPVLLKGCLAGHRWLGLLPQSPRMGTCSNL